MKPLTLLFGLLLLLIFSSTAHAVDVFIDNAAGCPGTGATGTPYCSIESAISAKAAGQIWKIRTGTGVYSITATTISGWACSSIAPCKITKDAGATFVIRNTANGSGVAALWLVNSDNVTVEGLTFDATGVTPGLFALVVQSGESANRTGMNVVGNTFRNWTQTNGQSVGPNALTYVGCSQALGCTNQRSISGVVEGNTFEGNHNKAIETRNTLNTHFRNNRITTMRCGRSGDGSANTVGIHFVYGHVGLRVYGNEIDNFVSKTGCPLATPGHATTAALWCDVDGFSSGISSDKQIFKNKIHNIGQGDGTTSMPNGGLSHGYYGVFIEAGCEDWKVYDNVIYRMGLSGITNRSPPTQAIVNQYYNNSLYDIAGYAFSVITGKANFTNNIVKLVGGAVFCQGCFAGSVAETTVTSNYNLYDDGTSQLKIGSKAGTVYNLANWRTQCSCDANSPTGDPLFISVTVGSENLALQATSPAIDTGTTFSGVRAHNGSAPDKGAFETIAFTSGEAGAVDPTTVVLNFENNTGPPLLPASACTGFTIEEDTVPKTISSCTRNGDSQFRFVVSVVFSGGTSLRFSYSPGNVTDSALIGNTANQRLNALTNVSITNNIVGGGGGRRRFNSQTTVIQ